MPDDNPTNVFYSWQSDTEARVCKSLIHDALQSSCDALTADLEEADRSYELDHDVKGETGSPEITAIIERKIRECDVFVADLTPIHVVEREDDPPKLIPNPNVMYEMGIAQASIGSERIIKVMNTAFVGAARKSKGMLKEGVLPFNIRHRSFPRCFEINANAEKAELRSERQSLVKQLTKDIGAITKRTPDDQAPPFEGMSPVKGCVSSFIESEEEFLHEHPVTFWQNEVLGGTVFARFIPNTNLDLTARDLLDCCSGQSAGFPPHSGSRTGNFGINKYGFASAAIHEEKEVPFVNLAEGTIDRELTRYISRDLIQYFKTGEVWAIFGSYLYRDLGKISWRVQELFEWSTQHSADFLKIIGYQKSGRMEFGITQLSDTKFLPYTPQNSVLANGDGETFHQNQFLYSEDTASCTHANLEQILNSASDRLCKEVGLERPTELNISLNK